MIKPQPIKGLPRTIQTLRGFRDFLPEQALKRAYVVDKIRAVFERFGFDPLETPALEYEEVLLGKYGEESDKLMYRFTDAGGRNVALRYDQTVPLARVVAQYRNRLPIPFKRYQIQPVWRAENPQKGRFREFLQCDIDSVGTASPLADAEIIATTLAVMKTLGFSGYSMRVNDRRIFSKWGLSQKAIIQLDKVDKEGPIVFIKYLLQEGRSTTQADSLFNEITNCVKPKDITNLFSVLSQLGLKEGRNYDFWYDPSLARGLDYYTSTIFELRIESYGTLSVGGGGRYDDLIGRFNGKNIPAVGFAFGFDRLLEAMEQLQLLPQATTATKVLVTVFSSQLLDNSLSLTTILRNNGINTDIILDPGAKLDKQLKYADRKGIPFAILVGPDEASKNVVKLKNMRSGEQVVIRRDDINRLKAEISG